MNNQPKIEAKNTKKKNMNIQDLKTQCNNLYQKTIELFERYGFYGFIRRKILIKGFNSCWY